MPKTGKNLKTNKKAAIAFLVVFGIFIIFIWGNGLRNNLSQPFRSEAPGGLGNTLAECAGGDCPSAEERNLKLKDTDKDGLVDWDELNIYNTSPYLEDTDSDGINDMAELETGTNPNCIGANCGVGNPVTDVKMKIGEEGSELSDKVIDESVSGSLELQINDGQVSEDNLLEILGGKSDVELLRESLLSAGMEKALLDQISDEALMASYQQILADFDTE